MNPTLPPSPKRRVWPWVVLAVLLIVPPILVILAVASFFRLNADTRALKNGLLHADNTRWQNKITLNGGRFSMSTVRAALSFAHPDAKVQALLKSVRSAEVSINELSPGEVLPPVSSMLAGANAAMEKRGWERLVQVVDGSQVVAIYTPTKQRNVDRLILSLAVLDHDKWIIGSVVADSSALLQLVSESVPKWQLSAFPPLARAE